MCLMLNLSKYLYNFHFELYLEVTFRAFKVQFEVKIVKKIPDNYYILFCCLSLCLVIVTVPDFLAQKRFNGALLPFSRCFTCFNMVLYVVHCISLSRIGLMVSLLFIFNKVHKPKWPLTYR